jgi:hypothetical protein
MNTSREKIVDSVGEILLEEYVEAKDVHEPEDFCHKVAEWLNTIQAFMNDPHAINSKSIQIIHNAMQTNEVTNLLENNLTDENNIDTEKLDGYVEAFGVLKEMAISLNKLAPRTWGYPGAESDFSIRY